MCDGVSRHRFGTPFEPRPSTFRANRRTTILTIKGGCANQWLVGESSHRVLKVVLLLPNYHHQQFSDNSDSSETSSCHGCQVQPPVLFHRTPIHAERCRSGASNRESACSRRGGWTARSTQSHSLLIGFTCLINAFRTRKPSTPTTPC